MAVPRHLSDLAGTRRNQFRINPADAVGPPATGYHQIGEEHVDSGGTRFHCTASGTPGTWANTSGYTHTQAVASGTWVIVHNLGRLPSAVSVTDSGGTVFIGDVKHDSINQTTITFTAPFTGTATLR